MLELKFALIEQPRLLAKAAFKILRPPAEDLRFPGLGNQLLLKLGNAAAEVFNPAALSRQFLRCCLQFDPLGIPASGSELPWQSLFPDRQTCPVTFTSARLPEMTAPSTVSLPVGLPDRLAASLVQPDRLAGGK